MYTAPQYVRMGFRTASWRLAQAASGAGAWAFGPRPSALPSDGAQPKSPSPNAGKSLLLERNSMSTRGRRASRLGWPMKARHGPPHVGTMIWANRAALGASWRNDAYGPFINEMSDRAKTRRCCATERTGRRRLRGGQGEGRRSRRPRGASLSVGSRTVDLTPPEPRQRRIEHDQERALILPVRRVAHSEVETAPECTTHPTPPL
jgi:hypothetical protein